jgi:hypothetical protein
MLWVNERNASNEPCLRTSMRAGWSRGSQGSKSIMISLLAQSLVEEAIIIITIIIIFSAFASIIRGSTPCQNFPDWFKDIKLLCAVPTGEWDDLPIHPLPLSLASNERALLSSLCFSWNVAQSIYSSNGTVQPLLLLPHCYTTFHPASSLEEEDEDDPKKGTEEEREIFKPVGKKWLVCFLNK